MAITIEMPRLSDSMREGTVLRWLKKTKKKEGASCESHTTRRTEPMS